MPGHKIETEDDILGHHFVKVGSYLGLDVSICTLCLATCRRGDTIYNRCPRAWD